jgi:DNA helicase II / ATP-dependent DNA helicase PcrA
MRGSAKPDLNPEQLQAVTHGDGPLLIIAGAGTGKTTVITERIKHLIFEKEVLPSDILALTFTEKAAREMEERVDVALPYGYTQMWISTFHAFCDRILKEEAIHIGLTPAFKLATEAETMMFLRKNMYKFDLTYFRPLGNPYKFLQGMVQHFSRLKDDDITPAQYLKYAREMANGKWQMANGDEKTHKIEVEKILELANAFKVYEDLKAEEGIMDFSDLISNVLKLFRERPNILTYYRQKFKYILVDEFQDTNYAQNEMAILLSGDKQNITVVGDDDQAIYRWRGAAIANIIQFREHFPKAKIVTLTQNYRSTSTILDASYKLIQHNNPDRLEVKEKINKKLTSGRGIKGEPVEFLFGPRVEHEADLVAERVKELIKKKKYSYKDFAILIRANDHAQPFTRSLERSGIPYQFLGPGHLFHQEEIKDLICYLKVLSNYEDSEAMYRVITQPIFGIPARDIASLLVFAKKKNLCLFEAMEQVDDTYLSDPVKEKYKSIVQMINKHLGRVKNDSAGQILYYFFEDSGLLRRFVTPESPMDEKRAQNIAKFFEKLKTYEAEHSDASIFAVVDWIDLSMQLGESPLAADVDWSEVDAVNILTVHSSKGLEFPVVFVVNLVTQRFPTRGRREQIPVPQDLIKEVLPEGDANLEEERRLFYVAMTRAKDYLYLTAANYYGEGKRERKISPFVIEVFGQEEIEKQLSKRKLETSVQQLSLMDILSQQKPTSDIDDAEETAIIAGQGATYYPVNFISYSQIQTFECCPLHYKLKYILKIPSAPVPALSFGSSVHAVLRDYYQSIIKGEVVDKTLVEKLLKNAWIDEGYSSRSHEKSAYDHAKLILNRYIEKNGIHKPLAVETPFQFYVGKMKVGGRIDRVDKLDDGRIEIIDYKTGDNKCDDKQLAKDVQLTLYALAATSVRDELFSKTPDEVVLSLYYLESEEKMTTTRTKEQLEEMKEYLIKKAEEISTSDFQCTGGIMCKNCEYKMLCQTFTN